MPVHEWIFSYAYQCFHSLSVKCSFVLSGPHTNEVCDATSSVMMFLSEQGGEESAVYHVPSISMAVYVL
jgi:hypothetical protein